MRTILVTKEIGLCGFNAKGERIMAQPGDRVTYAKSGDFACIKKLNGRPCAPVFICYKYFTHCTN